MKPERVTIPIKAIEQYFQVVLFIMLFKVVISFRSVDETLLCDRSNGSYCVLMFIILYKVVLRFSGVWINTII